MPYDGPYPANWTQEQIDAFEREHAAIEWANDPRISPLQGASRLGGGRTNYADAVRRMRETRRVL